MGGRRARRFRSEKNQSHRQGGEDQEDRSAQPKPELQRVSRARARSRSPRLPPTAKKLIAVARRAPEDEIDLPGRLGMEGGNSDAGHGGGGEHQRIGRREARERDPQAWPATRPHGTSHGRLRRSARRPKSGWRTEEATFGGEDEAGGRRDRESALGDEEREKRRDDALVDVVEEVRRRQQPDRRAASWERS